MTFTWLVAKLSHSPTPIVLSPIEKNGRVGQDIWKGVYYALVLTVRNPRKISNCLSKTKQRGCPVGVLYTYPKYRTAIGVSVPHMATIGMEVVLYISAWGLCVARFDRQGNAKASEREASDSAGLHAFFVSWSSIISYKPQGCRSPKPYKTLTQREYKVFQ